MCPAMNPKSFGGEYSKLFIFTVRRLTNAMDELDEYKMDAAKAN